jgi:hypothetical protein
MLESAENATSSDEESESESASEESEEDYGIEVTTRNLTLEEDYCEHHGKPDTEALEEYKARGLCQVSRTTADLIFPSIIDIICRSQEVCGGSICKLI